MPCSHCGKPTKKSTAKFCSVECKSESQRGKRESFDPTKQIKCLIDGKTFDMGAVRSGYIKKYSKNILRKDYDAADWEIIDIVPEIKETWNCPHCDWSTVDISNNSGWITTHLKNSHGLNPEDHCETHPEDFDLWKEYWKFHSIEKFKFENIDNRVQCKICNEWFRFITNTHLEKHRYTQEQYKNEFEVDTIVSKTVSDKLRNSYYDHRPELIRSNDLSEKVYIRNIQNMKCKICGKRCTSVGISQHLKSIHGVDISDYVLEYGEFRVNNKKIQYRLDHVGDKFKCLICDERFISDKSLTHHVQSFHDISKIEYVKRYIFSENPQLCECGCGQEVSYLSYIPYKRNVISGHNENPMSGNVHSPESKERMRISAIARGVSGRQKKDTLPERQFAKFLDENGISYKKQVRTFAGLIDFYIDELDLYVEIDGDYWHPVKVQNLTNKLLSSCVSQFRKSKLPNLVRIRATDIDKLKTVDDIFELNFEYDFSIEHRQVICNRNYLTKCSKDEKLLVVQNILKLLRLYQPDFPHPPVTDDLVALIDLINKFVSNKSINGNMFDNRTSTLGNRYLKSIFKSYWNSSFNGKKTPVQVWSDDKLMKSIIAYRIGLNDSEETFDMSLHQCLVGMSAARYTVSFFKPVLAAMIYHHFIGNIKSPTVFDPCAGFGGRMMGFKSMYPNGTYIACEPNIDTYNELITLANNFNNVRIYNCKIEDFDLSLLPTIDLSFSSIPYYDLEVYSNSIEYVDYDDWKTKFLGQIKKLPNLLLNIPVKLRGEFGECEEYFIKSATSHFDKESNSKLEYLLWFGDKLTIC